MTKILNGKDDDLGHSDLTFGICLGLEICYLGFDGTISIRKGDSQQNSRSISGSNLLRRDPFGTIFFYSIHGEFSGGSPGRPYR